jgi:hypothetical protein
VLYESPLLIVLLSGRTGSPLWLGEIGPAASSIFEVELFHASQKQVRAVYYVVKNYEPSPELLNLINILRLRENANWFVLTENEIEQHARSLFRQLRANGIPAEWAPAAIADRLSDGKSFPKIQDEITSTALSFIGKFGPRERSDFDMRRVEKLLGNAAEAATQASFTDQLSYLWMAMRELSIGQASELARTQKWIDLANQWPFVAAWLGLHGPLATGVSGAFHTQNELRQLGFAADRPFPYGAYASEFYSMGKACATPLWKKRRFSAAIDLATRHASLHPDDPTGALAIRASAKLQLAQLGKPWLACGAIADYRRVCRIRERNGANDSAIGEALVESAYAEFHVSPLLRRYELGRMREGVRLMEKEILLSRAGFIVRAKRKFSDALKKFGSLDEAEEQLKQATEIGRKYGVLGQLSQLSKTP